MKNGKPLFVILSIIVLYSILPAQNISERLDEYFTSAANDNEMNGNVLIAEDGKIIYKKSFGYEDFGNKIANSDSSLFQLASISKTFTAVAILQLKEKGKLKIDDPLSKYLPDFPYPEITISQILSHTSGLPDTEILFDSLIAKEPSKIFTIADDLPAIKIFRSKNQLLFKPGERWGYSSAGYQLLALLVEKLSGQSFAVYIKDHIFIPAGMNSSYIQTELSQNKDKHRAVSYQFNNHFEMKFQQMDTLNDWKEWTYNLSGLVGGNNVISNTIDLLKYDRALYSGVLLAPATLEEAFTPVKLNNGENNKAVQGSSCGLGWFIFNDTTAGKIVWHSGANPGVTTLFARNITNRQTIIVLHNVKCYGRVDLGALEILKNNPLKYKQSLAFIFARDLNNNGVGFAYSHFNNLKNDTNSYVLSEADIQRAGLEFSRYKGKQLQSLELYKLSAALFPDSPLSAENYASALWKNGKNEEAVIMLKKFLTKSPENAHTKKMLELYEKEKH